MAKEENKQKKPQTALLIEAAEKHLCLCEHWSAFMHQRM